MIVILSLLSAMALSQDIVTADPVIGILPDGIGKDDVAIPWITDAAVHAGR